MTCGNTQSIVRENGLSFTFIVQLCDMNMLRSTSHGHKKVSQKSTMAFTFL